LQDILSEETLSKKEDLKKLLRRETQRTAE
jgi:hypothetical protein